MTREEHADGSRRGPFPRRWGTPPGEVDSEERAGWIAGKVRQLVMTRKATPEDLRRTLLRKRIPPWAR